MQIADVETLMVQACEVVISFAEHRGALARFTRLLIGRDALAEVFILHRQLLVLLQQLYDLRLQRAQFPVEFADALLHIRYLCKNGLFVQTCSPRLQILSWISPQNAGHRF